ncbi:hypothetical protein KUL49_03750 [Alteromonas sp. KUL49]|nr:hypothetical protein KUL49_03750 [Alteromonas sp. KUL49]
MQNAMAMGLAAYSMTSVSALASDDIELICTGKDMHWISVSATQLQGKFVFVTPDLDETHSKHVDCTNSVLADTPQSTPIPSDISVSTHFVEYTSYSARIAQRPYISFAYAAPLSRAPPTI